MAGGLLGPAPLQDLVAANTSLVDDNAAMIFQSKIMIGSIIPNCVIEETYEDTVQITTHPVERGANMSDHAFMLPMGLSMKVAWADYKGKNSQYSVDMYKKLRDLQAKLEPLTVSTGKRVFQNMMIVGISVTNDQKTKHAVLADVRFKEIRQAGVVTEFRVVPAPKDQSSPQSTQDQKDLGKTQPAPTGPSQVTPPPNSPPDSTDSTLAPSAPQATGSTGSAFS